MKKMLAIILTVLMVLSLYPAFAEAVEAPDEATALDFNHKTYEANQLDALFSRHESVAYTFRYPLDANRNGYVWETSDSIYQEWGTLAAEFDRDRIHYMMSTDEATGETDVFGGVDYDPDYQPFYCFAGGTEEEFFDVEHDHVVELYEADGLILSASQFDETLSRKVIEENLGLTYEGQLIRSEIVVDAETYEVLESREVMAQDGEETIVYETTVAYDTPEPAASHNLRAPFERNSVNMMTLTFVVDHGTDHEFSRELTVPVNTEAGQMFGNTSAVCFDDADCETLSHWDRMSDKTLYIFTNPDNELTEKYQALLAKALQAMDPAEPDAATFEVLVAANTGSAILSRHASFSTDRSTARDGEEILAETSYRDADTYFWGFSDGRAMLRQADLWVDWAAKGEGVEAYTETIFDSVEAAQEAFAYALDSASVILPETETLLETVDTGDGRFVAITEESDPATVAWTLSANLPAGGYEYAEGMTLRYEYTFDTNTRDVLNIRTELTEVEGETLLTQEESFAYDVEAYDPFAQGEPFAEYEAAATDPKQNRTIAVVFDPDTENERGVEYVLPNHAFFSVFLNGQYVEQLYTDRECTQLFEGSDGISDLQLYVK